MRVSEGVPRGRFAELYHPEMFSEGEEVIVFTRDEFNRTYSSLGEQIAHINRTYLRLDRDEDWKLIGYWPRILERVHILDLNMDQIYKNQPLQCYLDAYLYPTIHGSDEPAAVSEKEGISISKVSGFDLL
ncbi:MAG: hypothetical protein LLF83_05975 [Methanobacterium sp.]|nr:hypothetical protein [Methanobacterium sp.]